MDKKWKWDDCATLNFQMEIASLPFLKISMNILSKFKHELLIQGEKCAILSSLLAFLVVI